MYPVALLPGLLCDAELWIYQKQALENKYDLIIPDLTQYESIIEMASTLLSVLPEKFALCGFSMGGYVAFEILRQAPDRVQKLAFINTTHRIDEPAIRQRRLDFIELASRGKFKGVTPQLMKSLVDKSNIHNQSIRDIVFGMAKRVGQEGFIRQEKAILSRIDSTSLLHQINVPTLIIGGQSDQLISVEHQVDMHRLIPKACLRLIENAGHITPLEAPDLVTEYLKNWLRS
ncbi:MAG: alpha/beta hydrolase [Alphaproteobacteria bacterium]|nr:alpha/beta hydrolase [Alphaproteobacteria bacterium]